MLSARLLPLSRVWGCRSGGAVHRPAHLAQRLELALGRRVRRLQVLVDAQRPAGRLADLLDLDPRVDRDQLELAVLRAWAQDTEVGDDDGRAGPGEVQLLAGPAAVAVADRGHEVELLDEAALRLAHDHDDLPRGGRDLRRAP